MDTRPLFPPNTWPGYEARIEEEGGREEGGRNEEGEEGEEGGEGKEREWNGMGRWEGGTRVTKCRKEGNEENDVCIHALLILGGVMMESILVVLDKIY